MIFLALGNHLLYMFKYGILMVKLTVRQVAGGFLMEQITSDSRIFANYEQYLNPAIARLFRFMGLSRAAQEAAGCMIVDQTGKEYIDCLGGYGVFSLGHRHPHVIQAVQSQLNKMPLSSKILFDAKTGELAERLAAIVPGDLTYSFFVNSGTEAVEGALKLARIHTGRSKLISANN